MQRQCQCRILATDDRRQAIDLLIAYDVRVPELVGEAGRVREQVTQRDCPLWCSGTRLTVGVEPFEHHSLTQFRNYAARRHVECEFALLDQLHGSRAGQCFGHRGNPHDGIGSHLGRLAQNTRAETTLVDWSVSIGSNGYHSRNIT